MSAVQTQLAGAKPIEYERKLSHMCEHCGAVFPKGDQLQRHVSRRHKQKEIRHEY